MKCPRCNTVNEDRTVCEKCGYFLYHPDRRGTRDLTPMEIKKKDRRLILNFLKRVGKAAWLILMILVMTLWIFMIMYLFIGY